MPRRAAAERLRHFARRRSLLGRGEDQRALRAEALELATEAGTPSPRRIRPAASGSRRRTRALRNAQGPAVRAWRARRIFAASTIARSLPIADVARQVLHAAVGREDHALGRDVAAARARCARRRSRASRPSGPTGRCSRPSSSCRAAARAPRSRASTAPSRSTPACSCTARARAGTNSRSAARG